MSRKLLLLLVLAGCSRSTPAAPPPAARTITPLSCGAGCDRAADCANILSSCRYCDNGKCSATLTAAPLDAGVDAPVASPK